MDPGECQCPASIESLEGGWNQFSGGREQDRRVQRLRRRLGSRDGRGRSESQSKLPGFLAAGHHVHGGATGDRHLGGQVGTSAEPVDPQPTALGYLRPLQRVVADQPGAQQGRELVVGVPLG